MPQIKTGCKKPICFNKNCKNNILSKLVCFVYFFSYQHICKRLSPTQALHQPNLGRQRPRIPHLPWGHRRLKQRLVGLGFSNGKLRVVLLLFPARSHTGIANQRSKPKIEPTFRKINSHPNWRWYACHAVEGGWKRKRTKGIHANCLELNIWYRRGAIIIGRPWQGGHVCTRTIYALADRTS